MSEAETIAPPLAEAAPAAVDLRAEFRESGVAEIVEEGILQEMWSPCQDLLPFIRERHPHSSLVYRVALALDQEMLL